MCPQQYTGELHISSNNFTPGEMEGHLHTLKLTLLLMVELKS